MISRRSVLLFAATNLAFAGHQSGTPSRAQPAWPSRELHSISGFPPGSGVDILVRFYSQKLQEALGKTVVVENKVGAFGNISLEYVSKAKPDGYTFLVTPGSSVLAPAPALYKRLAFNPLTDFEHVTTLAKTAFLLVVAGQSPFGTVSELTTFLKAQGERASYGSMSNTGLVSSELYKAQFGLPTVEVKYKDPAGLLNDLYNGNLAFAHLDPIFGATPLRDGKIRALA